MAEEDWEKQLALACTDLRRQYGLNLVVWLRQDGKVFYHAEKKGHVISNRLGPFDTIREMVISLKSPPDPQKDCGPVSDYHLAKLRKLQNGE